MPLPSTKSYIDAFKSINGILAGIGVLVPGFSYFTLYSPPFLEESSLLTAAFATATIIIAYYHKPKGRTIRGTPPLVRLARKLLIISVVILILYLVLLRLCTVVHPAGKLRYQIGFGKSEWSLTDAGRQWKALNPLQTVQEWMMSASAFKPGGPELIWKPWTIYLAGILMIIVFATAFILWTFGWALLAKQKSIEKK